MMRPAVLVFALLAGCVLSPIDPSGRACDELDRCADGWTCDLATHTCVMTAVDAGPIDAPRTDVPGLDAPELDAPELDAPELDAPELDADAGPPPVCTPACHPELERCTAAGCELLDYGPSTFTPVATPVVRILGRSFTDRAGLEVDFDTLGPIDGATIDDIDILLIRPTGLAPPPAAYDTCLFANIPVRTADRPLVIASTEGPVRCRYGVFQGGSHWVLTGRYDSAMGIGSAVAPGHADGYAHTQGRYGWEFLESATVTPATTVADAHVTVDHVELSGLFASSAQLSFDIQGTASVVVRESYLHDAADDALALRGPGSVLAALVGNRVVRAGGECVDLRGSRDGSVVRNNALVSCGTAAASMRWATDSGAAMIVASATGTSRITRNVIAGSRGAGVFGMDLGGPGVAAPEFDVSQVVIDGVYGAPFEMAPAASPTPPEFDARMTARAVRISDNAWRWAGFVNHDVVVTSPFYVYDVGRPTWFDLADVRWDPVYPRDRPLPLGYDGYTAATDVQMVEVAGVTFADFMGAAAPFDVEHWYATSCRPVEPPATPGECAAPAPRHFLLGSIVTHLGVLYRADRETTEADVPGVSDAWIALAPQPADDLVLTSSPLPGIGLP